MDSSLHQFVWFLNQLKLSESAASAGRVSQLKVPTEPEERPLHVGSATQEKILGETMKSFPSSPSINILLPFVDFWGVNFLKKKKKGSKTHL